MTDFILYMAQSSMVFICLFCLYKVLFNKVTFHHLNRGILVAIPLIALLAPWTYLIIPTTPVPMVQVTTTFNEFVVESGKTISQTFTESAVTSSFIVTGLIYSYGLVCLLLFGKMMHSIWLVVRLKKQSATKKREGYQLVASHLPQAFSFFNWIFIPHSLTKENDSLIIEHEKAHIRLGHSLDIFLSEVYIILFWFNPLVYAYRKSLKSIHEYQADAWVLKGDVKTSSYLQALLQNIEVQTTHNLYTYFNQSLIKKRIDMITKRPTRKSYKFTYVLFLASIVFISAAFTKPRLVSDLLATAAIPQLTNTAAVIKHRPPSLFPVKNGNKQDITSFYGKVHRKPQSNKLLKHQGIDIRATIGTPVLATADGIVVKASDDKGWGNLVIINHENNYQTRYAHLKGFATQAKKAVKKGDIIGYVGNTGLSFGPHLHYEVRLNDKTLNPLNFIK